MAEARVGDDVYGEDQTTRLLETRVAKLYGMEGALFVPSGTMANLLGVLGHCVGRGQEVVLGSESHIYLWEQGGVAQFGGVHTRPVRNLADGTFDLDELRSVVQDDQDPHTASTSLVCIENTHNSTGGRVIPQTWLADLVRTCSTLHLPVHCDGARLLHSAVALGVEPHKLLQGIQSATLCLSKGLGAPVGSCLVGSRGMVARARRTRKALGGGMRQTGILSAAGLYGLDHIYPRLYEDHAKAMRLAKLVNSEGKGLITVAMEKTDTNILLLRVDKKVTTARRMVELLSSASYPVLSLEWDSETVRLVTHRDITDTALCQAEETIRTVLRTVLLGGG